MFFRGGSKDARHNKQLKDRAGVVVEIPASLPVDKEAIQAELIVDLQDGDIAEVLAACRVFGEGGVFALLHDILGILGCLLPVPFLHIGHKARNWVIVDLLEFIQVSERFNG